MADTETATSTPSPSGGGSGAQQAGTEFSRPQGVEDDAIWEKHFGGEKGKDSRSRSGKPKSDESSKSDKSGSRSGERSSSTKPDTASPSKPKASKSKDEKDDSSEKDTKADTGKGKTEPKPSKSPDKTADTEKDETEPDPDKPEDAEVSARAKELFAEAKASKDPKEARRLYRRAMKEAFGEVPEEFDDRKYYLVRKERAAAQAAIDEKAAKNEGRIREAAERLRPAIGVMQMLEKAGIAERLTVPLVEKAIHVLKALRSLEDGDFTQLGEVVARASGCDHDEAMKRFIRGVKVSPEGRAARAAAQQAEERAARAEARLVELEKRLTDGETARTKAETDAQRKQALAERRAQYLDDLQTDLADHPVLKLQRGAERVMAYLIKTADRKLRAAKYTPQQAADRIVAYERKRAREAAALDTEGEEVAATPTPRSTRGNGSGTVRSLPRSEQRENGVASESAEASLDRIIRKHNWGH